MINSEASDSCMSDALMGRTGSDWRWLVCEWISLKEELSVWTGTKWPDSLLSRCCSSLCCSLFSYQSGEEDWEPTNHMLSLGHCHQILANNKQESIATVSMKKKRKKTFHFVRSSSFSFSQSVTLGLPIIYVNLMSRSIYTLSTVVFSKCTHNYEVAAMHEHWTRSQHDRLPAGREWICLLFPPKQGK